MGTGVAGTNGAGRRIGASLLAMICLSCGKIAAKPEIPGVMEAAPVIKNGDDLEKVAEIERSGGFLQGMALMESALKEESGDYAGAVIAAYKELAWSYGYGGLSLADLEAGLGKVQAPEGENSQKQQDADAAARGTLAYLAGRWTEAEKLLEQAGAAEEDPDGFSKWMLLVCALEKGDDTRKARSAYGAIRARYEKFPEYWYRGARFFSGQISLQYAERCINLSPAGPFAPECRAIIALDMGLSLLDGAAIKSRAEIEYIISQSASSYDPEMLMELFPLISLPDNVYTMYAIGALRALAAEALFRDFFYEQERRSSGRLAERLSYAARGGV
ncbi:hypothetical protein FACS1894147_05350 [Spirochaetia bacterium]|nr:hypothetical protein FACS1894147_05350 [Spirochaetia bacterium]